MNKLLELWEQEAIPADLPPRSRFYCLEPVGLGTGMVESLTSYITRVARAHFLPPWVLVTRDLAPAFRTVKSSIGGHCDLFAHPAVSINGNCGTARECAGHMERLTLREGLGKLTLAALSDIVAPAALLHPFEHWCPICLEEWRRLGTEAYALLLWQVRAVTVCSRHHCVLEAVCPRCQRRHRPFARHGRSCHCPWCQRWLGSNTPARGSAVNKSFPHDFVAFMAEEAEHLLSKRETILCSSEHVFSDNIRFLRKCHGSSLASFAREVGHHVKSVQWWIENRQKPRLYALAVIAHRYGLRAIDLVGSRLSGDLAPRIRPLPTAMLQGLKPQLRRHDTKILRQALEEAANTDQLPPPSLASVGRKLQCHSSYLQRKFPDLASQISRAYREYWSIHKSQRLYFAKLVTKSKSSEIAARGEYPSQRKVIRALPSGLSFRMPVVKEAWLETLKEWGLKPAMLTPKATVGRG